VQVVVVLTTAEVLLGFLLLAGVGVVVVGGYVRWVFGEAVALEMLDGGGRGVFIELGLLQDASVSV
jgi:hypothetical protein